MGDMVNTGREPNGLGNLAPVDHPMASQDSLSSKGGFSSAELMLLRAAIDGDFRLFQEMVMCLDKGNGAAATVASIAYKGANALDMALWMGRTAVSQYLLVDLGMEATDIDNNDDTGLIVNELKSMFPYRASVGPLMPEGASVGPLMPESASVGLLMPEGQFSWELLPTHIVECIACTFKSAEIYVTVKSVCKKWYSALSELPPPRDLRSTQIPFLLLPPLQSGDPYKCWKLRNANNPSPDSHFTHLCLTAGNVVVGSSFGWVHVFEPQFFSLFTLNPVTGQRIELPSLLGHCSASMEPTMLVQHAVLSANPSISSLWVLLVFLTAELTRCLSYRHGDITWTEHTYDAEFSAEDVVCFRDRFVALDGVSKACLLDLTSDEPDILFINFEKELSSGSHHLLVGPSQQDLFMVTTRTFDNPMLSEGHLPVIEKLFISTYFVKRRKHDFAGVGAMFLGNSCSVVVDCACVPPSLQMGVYKPQTCCCLMGVKGRMFCGCVVRSSQTEIGNCRHDITHCQLFPRNDVWSSMRPWWVTPNICKVGTNI